MSLGFGVAVLVHELSKGLLAVGHNVCIGTLHSDYEIPGIQTYIINPDPEQIRGIAQSQQIDVIIAQTSPFFEVLPALAPHFKCWAWENGDPSPEFFEADKEERKHIIVNKQMNVYPYVNGIITISRFLSYDIEYLDSEVIHIACDHTADLGKKTTSEINLFSKEPLKIGTLMRLGEGEALYKGNKLFLELCDGLKADGVNAEFYVMGRGSSGDAKMFEDKGIKVLRNASDEKRAKYLRELDIFISPSQWEGFNLPIVEAMKSGTMGMVFDVGAHPEVCPFLYSSISEMAAAIKRYSENKSLLLEHSEKCYNFVGRRFSWRKTVMQLLEVLSKNGAFSNSEKGYVPLPQNTETIIINKQKSNLKKGLESLKNDGILKTWRKARNVMFR